MKAKINAKILVLAIIFITLLIGVIFTFKKIMNSVESYSIIENNIFIVQKDGDKVQVTNDGNGITKKYLAPAIKNGKLFFFKCELKNDKEVCTLEIYKSGNYTSVLTLTNIDSANNKTFNWSPDKNYFTFTNRNTLFFSNTKSEKEILKWDLFGKGIGGQYCDGIIYSPDSSFFSFCKSTAIDSSILGKIFLFDKNGKEIKELSIEDTSKPNTGLINPEISNTDLVFWDTSSNTQKSIDFTNL